MREPLSGETTNQSFQSRFALHTLENVEKRAGTITGWHKTPFGSGSDASRIRQRLRRLLSLSFVGN
jgi:hypothetical protein